MPTRAEQPAHPFVAQYGEMIPAAADQRNVSRTEAILIGVDADGSALADQAMTRGQRDSAFNLGQSE